MTKHFLFKNILNSRKALCANIGYLDVHMDFFSVIFRPLKYILYALNASKPMSQHEYIFRLICTHACIVLRKHFFYKFDPMEKLKPHHTLRKTISESGPRVLASTYSGVKVV
jgi:hypothetical protein